MSWMQKLIETYHSNDKFICDYSEGNPLLPICHTDIKSNIEVTIDMDGEFCSANVIPPKKKDDSNNQFLYLNDPLTIIPCTEKSESGRSGQKPVPHPLCDKLQYLSKDFNKFGGIVTSGFSSNPSEPYELYIAQLIDWCSSEYSTPEISAICKFCQKGILIEKLIESCVLVTNSDNQLISKWSKKKDESSSSKDVYPENDLFDNWNEKYNGNKKPEIFESINNQMEAVIRWVIEIPGESDCKVWKSQKIQDSWINYYLSKRNDNSDNVCIITGEKGILLSDQHPKKILPNASNAKLISSNKGFTYLGRFKNATEAATISFSASQQIHKTIPWLIKRQGTTISTMSIVAWSVSGTAVPSPTKSTNDIVGEEDSRSNDDSGIENIQTTSQEFGNKFSKAIQGYGKKIASDEANSIVVLAIDALSDGRASIVYYRELTGSDFLKKINNWHTDYAWFHKTDNNKSYIGVPSPEEISKIAYGNNISDKLLKQSVLRIVSCIIDGQRLPYDILHSVVLQTFKRTDSQN